MTLLRAGVCLAGALARPQGASSPPVQGVEAGNTPAPGPGGFPRTGASATDPEPSWAPPPEGNPLVVGRDPDTLVFRTARGKPLRIRNRRNREFNKARTEAGLDDMGLTIHKLRHTAASLSISGGADVYVVQRMLGHAKPSMTLDTYGHLWPDRLDEVADVIDARRTEQVAWTLARAA
ncbi:tyrosine-type recombinase/integrase [Nocardiopsis lambiniae]|uniref:Tyrosine-type recombinase/integrase n=1 Tax=Nocardiopsis lambiniae TaxID=3075539 RepID=A0ABU2MC45_9ACTN|nr:tyrosine-type recombinase/integrase [Nocardiopsis sp. DSM 44743]MDT0329831.1 tyrosine-type recombinase/integrase [Nocardiopsis sp. DSM 44743]